MALLSVQQFAAKHGVTPGAIRFRKKDFLPMAVLLDGRMYFEESTPWPVAKAPGRHPKEQVAPAVRSFSSIHL